MAAKFNNRLSTGKFGTVSAKSFNPASLHGGLDAWRRKRRIEENTGKTEIPAKVAKCFTRALAEKENLEKYVPHGSRIVDLDVLKKKLLKCQFCEKGPLSLANVLDEKQYGLASKLRVKCQFCAEENTVETSSAHKSGKCGPMAYDINSKAALASLHTGIGETHLNGILSIMNIPPMTRASFKTRERETGKMVETVAKTTCEESQSWKSKQNTMDREKEYLEMKNKLSQCYLENNELKDENEWLKGQLQKTQSELTMRTNEVTTTTNELTMRANEHKEMENKLSRSGERIDVLEKNLKESKQEVEQLEICLRQKKEFTTGYTPCSHSCMPLSLEHTCWQKGTPICILNLVMNAAFSAGYSAGQSAPDPLQSAKLLECAQITDLLIDAKIVTHMHTINVDNEHPITVEEAIRKVIEKVPNTCGLLGYDKLDYVHGHCVCFQKLQNNQVRIWDAQRRKLLSHDDFKNVTAVYSFDVNTPRVQSLSATSCCLANSTQPMDSLDILESLYINTPNIFAICRVHWAEQNLRQNLAYFL